MVVYPLCLWRLVCVPIVFSCRVRNQVCKQSSTMRVNEQGTKDPRCTLTITTTYPALGTCNDIVTHGRYPTRVFCSPPPSPVAPLLCVDDWVAAIAVVPQLTLLRFLESLPSSRALLHHRVL